MTTLAPTATDRYTIISSDCHAGANHATYREYLTTEWQEEFDAWRGKYANPFRDLQDDGRSRNWDDERRVADLHADGIVAEVTFPNTVPPFFPTGAVIAAAPTARQLRASPRRHPRAQPLARRLLQRAAGPTRRARADLPQRRRRRGARHLLGQRARAAQHPAAGGRAQLAPGTALRAGVRPGVARRARRPACPSPRTPVAPGCPTSASTRSPTWCSCSSRRSTRTARCGTCSCRACSSASPTMKFAMTEQGSAWVPELLERLDNLHAQMRARRSHR